jgi:hypothetical protein
MIDPDDDNTSTAELAEAMRLHRFNRLADQLIEEFGPCPLPRADLLAFLADQLERIKAVGVPDSTTATAMIDAAYLELQTQHG